MNVVVLRETTEGEARVALVPESVVKLVGLKAKVLIESNAGLGAARTDDDYTQAGPKSENARHFCKLLTFSSASTVLRQMIFRS